MNVRLLLVPLILSTGSVGAAESVDFAHDVLPLLKSRCAECHTAGKYKGGLSLDTRANLLRSKAVVPGASAKSPLLERITSTDPEMRMPPKGPALTVKEVALLRAWIDQGLVWQEGFSFAKGSYVAPLRPRRPELPPPLPGRIHPIDRLVDGYFAVHKISTPEDIDDATFLRRVSLDLIGLLPTPEQRDTFLSDRTPERRARLVDRLLADRIGYAEHWLTFWNDLLRNDYVGTGYIDGGRKAITPWLYRALLDNMPYDQFVRQLIAPTPDSEGFIKGIKWRGVVNASQVPELQFAQNVSQVFLGINMKCASCHDSFIDSWRLEDAYGLAAIVADTPLAIHRCDKPTGAVAKARFPWPELGQIDATQTKAERLRRFAALLTRAENGRLSRTIVNRLWQRLMGRGLVHPVDVMAGEPWSGDVLDFLATHLVDQGYDLKKTLRLIVTSRIYQARCVPATDPGATDYLFHGPVARRMTAEQFLDAVWRITGTAPGKSAASFGDRGKADVRASLVIADPLMRSLGRPNREQVVTTRPEELTTLQALDLTNGRILAETLERGAKNLHKLHPKESADGLLDRIYRAALTRQPNDEERHLGREVLGATITEESLTDLLWLVVMLPEFQMVR